MRKLTISLIVSLAACAGVGAGNYRTGRSSMGEAKSSGKVRGFGTDCRDWDQCEEKFGLTCMRGICTFQCSSDADCEGAKGVCVAVRPQMPDSKVCAPRG